jgi:hypothetical protein
LPREHLSLDANWKFHLGDEWPEAINYVNAGKCGGPAAQLCVNGYLVKHHEGGYGYSISLTALEFLAAYFNFF